MVDSSANNDESLRTVEHIAKTLDSIQTDAMQVFWEADQRPTKGFVSVRSRMNQFAKKHVRFLCGIEEVVLR